MMLRGEVAQWPVFRMIASVVLEHYSSTTVRHVLVRLHRGKVRSFTRYAGTVGARRDNGLAPYTPTDVLCMRWRQGIGRVIFDCHGTVVQLARMDERCSGLDVAILIDRRVCRATITPFS